MGNTTLDEGASIAVGTADDGTVGGNSDTINLDIVQTSVVVDKTCALRVCGVDTAVGGDDKGLVHPVGIFIPYNIRSDFLDTRVQECCIGIDVRHVVAKVEFNLVGGENRPLIGGVLDIAFALPKIGTGDVDLGGVDGADSESTGSFGSGGTGERGHCGGREKKPGVGVAGEIETSHQTVGIAGHGIQIALVGGSKSEVDISGLGTETFAAASDVDRSFAIDNIADFVHTALAGEEGAIELLGDHNGADITLENRLRSLSPVALLSDNPAEEAFGSGNVDVCGPLSVH